VIVIKAAAAIELIINTFFCCAVNCERNDSLIAEEKYCGTETA
jgi:hypothetical protein